MAQDEHLSGGKGLTTLRIPRGSGRGGWRIAVGDSCGGVLVHIYRDESLVASGVGDDEPAAILRAAMQLAGFPDDDREVLALSEERVR